MMLHERFKPENPGVVRLLLAITAACLCTVALSADQAGFSGKVVVELLDEVEFVHKMRLVDDFAFTDAGGKVWFARKGGILDGESVPRELYSLGSLPSTTQKWRKRTAASSPVSTLRVACSLTKPRPRPWSWSSSTSARRWR